MLLNFLSSTSFGVRSALIVCVCVFVLFLSNDPVHGVGGQETVGFYWNDYAFRI